MAIRVMFIAPAADRALREARFSGGRDQGVHGDEGHFLEGELEPSGVSEATVARGILQSKYPVPGRVFVSPTARSLHTARILGLDAVPAHELAPCAMGRWRGRTLDAVTDAEPDPVARWLADPAATPHGGESLLDLLARVAHWLDALGAQTSSAASGPGPGSATVTVPVGDSGAATDPVVHGTVAADPVVHSAATGQRVGARDGARFRAPSRVTVVAEPDVVRAAAVHALGAGPMTFWRFDVRPLSVTELTGRGGRWNLLGGRPLHAVPTD